MPLHRENDRLRIDENDPVHDWIGNKIEGGQGVNVRIDESDNPRGHRVVIDAASGPGGGGNVLVVTEAFYAVPANTTMVLIQADNSPMQVTLPCPAEAGNWLAAVAIDTSCPIEIVGNIFDRTGLLFNMPGDAFIFASNRVDTWYIVAKYNAHFDYY